MSATSTSEYRLAMRLSVTVAAAAVASSVWPGIDLPLTLALVAAGLIALLVVAVRRELRIRRVLAAIRPLPIRTAVDAPAGAAQPAATSDDAREVA